MLSPDGFLLLSNLGFLSPDSKSYSFDHRANGYARGEGVIALVLKPLADAVKNGDMIRAVIRSTGTNQDGRTPSLTQPSPEAQEDLIRHVYRKANLPFEWTRYVEAHGNAHYIFHEIHLLIVKRNGHTGWRSSGDESHRQSFQGVSQCRGAFICVSMHLSGLLLATSTSMLTELDSGSVKSNIGHLEGCSGLAGIIKSICEFILKKSGNMSLLRLGCSDSRERHYCPQCTFRKNQ